MIYTSGTTGRPKGVKRRAAATVRDALAGQERYGRSIGLDGSGPHLVTGPLYHSAPLMYAVYDQQNGAPVVVMPRFESGRPAAVAENCVAHTHRVPTMFVRLAPPDAERGVSNRGRATSPRRGAVAPPVSGA